MNLHLDRNSIGHLLRSRGIDAWGVADNRGGVLPLSPDLPTALVMLRRLRPAALDGLEHGPTPAYYEEYGRLNADLGETAAFLADTLAEGGREAVVIPPTAADATAAEFRYSHKAAATQAGIGWIGKTALLVTPEFGSAVRLASVFTDLELPAGRPVTASRCGRCTRCVEACPADAGRDTRWEAGMPRDELLDAAACEAHMQRTATDFNRSICGICIAVCPYTRAALDPATALPSPIDPHGAASGSPD